MAVAIPEAFGDRALLFAGSYVAIQLGRHAFLTFVAAPAGTLERERAGQILIWFVAAGAFWLAGGLAEGATRITLWLAALVVDYAGPVTTFWVPGRKRLRPEAWRVGSSHFAERFQLFIILALGETIVITGATTSDQELGPTRLVAFSIAFLGTAAFWWLSFLSTGRIGERQLEVVRDRTTLARDAYTYLHGLIAAGIIVAAVGDELVIAHPTETLSRPELIAVVAGPVIYLLAQALFRRRVLGGWSRGILGGVVASVAEGLAGMFVPAMMVAALLVAVLVGVIAGEHLEPASVA
jgi:low temperature requirement protein LtrA